MVKCIQNSCNIRRSSLKNFASYKFESLRNQPMTLISLGLPEEFGSIAKKGVGVDFLALKSHICSSKKSCMKTKVDIVCFSLNSVFLIDPKKWRLRKGKRCTGFFFFFFAIWSQILFLLFFSFSPLSLFLSSPLYHASFAPSHLGYAHLI